MTWVDPSNDDGNDDNQANQICSKVEIVWCVVAVVVSSAAIIAVATRRFVGVHYVLIVVVVVFRIRKHEDSNHNQ